MKSTYTLLLLLISFCVFSQENKPNTATASVGQISTAIVKAKSGTYQIIISDTKLQHVFTEETLILIEAKRKENEDTTINLREYVDVFIPSKNSIESKNFKLLPEFLYK